MLLSHRAPFVALTLWGCAAAPPPPAPPSDAALAVPAAPGSSAPDVAVPPTAAPAAPMPPYASRTPALARFHAALNGLERKTRKEHVRALWLGDSHGQADFWSGQLRKRLQAKFGDGGPGFLHLGYKNYRHDGIKLDIQGKWRMRPKKPVDPRPQGDGVYGLGGLMMSGYADTPRVDLVVSEPLPGKAMLDLCFRTVEPQDTLAYALAEARETTLPIDAAQHGKVRHLALEAGESVRLRVRPIGRTDLCGVVVETNAQSHAGVVLDTLAINGARYGTMLAWDERAWIEEVRRRSPQLIILELGTNEAGDANPAYKKVSAQMGELLARARKGAPEADCVVISSTDRADAESRTTQMHATLEAAAQREGCFWFDAWTLLGGEGAFAKLREEPDPKVQPDGIHLTIKGYRALGDAMFDAILAGY